MNTPWGEALDPERVLPEYPRPQLVRDSYINLNGFWDYAVNSLPQPPRASSGKILVPFSPEAELSGVGRRLKPGEHLWYFRSFTLPKGFNKGRVLLHFGAVDQFVQVILNGQSLATHTGGYTAFTVDLTKALKPLRNHLTLRVKDDTDNSWHSRGKQRSRRGGIWYTPQSGIWQTVWLESVPMRYVRSLYLKPLFDQERLEVTVFADERTPCSVKLPSGEFSLKANQPASFPVPGLKPWTPEEPVLHDIEVTAGEDRVKSYFAMRKFSVERDEKGAKRLFLNNKPYFMNGLLDQGYWPDGLYTAPSDEALIYDIQAAKDMGFNTLRKHIKIEPMRWYYHCDRLGMLVWQDMPSGGGIYNTLIISAPLLTGLSIRDDRPFSFFLFSRNEREGRKEYFRELKEMVEQLRSCPCIAMWVPFNEGWGQFKSRRACELIRELDDSRLIDHASGWHDQGFGDIKSLHVYFKKYRFRPDKRGRAVILSEFGGYGLRLPGHSWGEDYAVYKKCAGADKFRQALQSLYSKQVAPAAKKGLSAAIYTQLSDVEDEQNGLLTYDRRVMKLPAETVREIVSIEQ